MPVSQTTIQTIRIRRRLEKLAYVDFYNAIRSQYNSVLDYIEVYAPIQLLRQVDNLILEAEIKQAMINAYSSASIFALKQRNQLMGQKEDMWNDIFLVDMRNYVLSSQSEIISNITNTTKKYITSVIEKSIAEGLGIEDTSEMIVKGLRGRDALGITRSRAKTIARTEILKANAVAQNKGIKSVGFPVEKKWEDSGLEGVRETHIAASAEGWVDEDHVFRNGLRQPGDPSGAIGEVINCRCVLRTRRKGV